jgi:hypothetical protein
MGRLSDNGVGMRVRLGIVINPAEQEQVRMILASV